MRSIGRGRLSGLLVLLTASASLVGCSGEGPAADLTGSRPVSFAAADGVGLEGRLFGDGTSAVVLSHMRPADQTSWYRFANRLADAGFLVLTYDFRGYCPGGDGGCSEGDRDIDSMWQDVVGAVAFVRERGAADVSLVGASMGGTASLGAAARGLNV
jgi:pimeloyl-ACP methyl ester carboxylesterase